MQPNDKVLTRNSREPGPSKILKGQIWSQTILKRPNFFEKFAEITIIKVRIDKNIVNFAQIFPKQALKFIILLNI